MYRIEMEECIICYEEINHFIFFSCGHKTCPTCFPKLHQCPFCQTDIEIQIPVLPTQQTKKEDYCRICCSCVAISILLMWSLRWGGII